MRKLAIKISDQEGNILQTLICSHLDAVKSHTVLIGTIITSKGRDTSKLIAQFTIAESINHWNIMDGLITIYYDNGFEMEISRLND